MDTGHPPLAFQNKRHDVLCLRLTKKKRKTAVGTTLSFGTALRYYGIVVYLAELWPQFLIIRIFNTNLTTMFHPVDFISSYSIYKQTQETRITSYNVQICTVTLARSQSLLSRRELCCCSLLNFILKISFARKDKCIIRCSSSSVPLKGSKYLFLQSMV